MSDDPRRSEVADTMRRVNEAWLGGRLDDLSALLHPDIVMVFPDFVGRAQGRDTFLGGFEDFCSSARILDFRDSEIDIDLAGHTAVVTFLYEMLYQRLGVRYRVTGRDMWIFEKRGLDWLAVWRTMLDTEETTA